MKLHNIKPNYQVNWVIETDYCHNGMPLSNGIFGALLWFQDNTLMVTVNRADYWEHRGGVEWNKECTFENVVSLLKQERFDEVKKLFASKQVNGKEKPPTRLPMGRYEIKLKPEVRFEFAVLNLQRAEAVIHCSVPGGSGEIKASILIDQPMLAVSLREDWVETIECRPAYDFPKVESYFNTYGIPPYTRVQEEGVLGWVQELPDDPACAVLLKREQDFIRIAAVYEENALQTASRLLQVSKGTTYASVVEETKKAWQRLWDKTADISLPDQELVTMYYLGIYKMLGNSMPGGIAPTLQGPWVEEYQLPAWKSDYHFNINVQECLWPAYAANHLEALKPLFDMLDRWKPLLADRAKTFTGTDDGYYLPHSTDDRGTVCGGFWTGTLDFANTSWVAQMMWQYARYSEDDEFLLNEVYPFMKKTLNLFHKTMHWDGTSYSMPVTVSPEYGGTANDAWGANSTFFLVNVHFLCEKLIWIDHQFALQDPYIAQVNDISQHLPAYSTGAGPFGEEILIWEGQPLAESHRHHSHLAGIFPFETMDPEDEQQKQVIRNSYRRWVKTGMGNWTGWSMPWASILHGRLGSKEMAYNCLKLFEDTFVMPGYGTRHNAVYEGFTLYTGGDIMQSECGIAYAAAVLELFVQCKRGEICLFPSLPDRFTEASFAGIRTEGAFLISASRLKGTIVSVDIYSEKGAALKLRNPFPIAVVHTGEQSFETAEAVIQLSTAIGQTISMLPQFS
ncbi:MAG: hypothetical protein JWN30_1333 [Bacilli bacterium]|nr:hypothetical protein [Bacilli bacterium]